MKIVFSVVMSLFFFIILDCVSTKRINVGQQTAHYLEKKITRKTQIRYLLYLPKGYGRSKKEWPLILFLHGAGERGQDLNKVKVHGPPKLIEEGKKFPFIVLSPQCPENQWWSLEDLDVLLTEVSTQYRVDLKRIYVTGLSMGGFGTWSLAAKYPDRFAAIAPICGGGESRTAHLIKNLPIWVFHGAKDKTVKIEQSQRIVDALKEIGSNVKFTIYPDTGHDSWTETYNNPNLYNWFLQFSLK